MPEPTDEELLAEAERLRQADANKRLPIWPFFYCVLPILLALGLIVFVNRPSNNDGRQKKANAVPDLGAQGRPLVKPPPVNTEGEKPPDAPTDGTKEPVKDVIKDGSKDGEKPPDKPPIEEPKPVSDFEIEIAIRNIGTGVKNNNYRTVRDAQEWLRRSASLGPVVEKLVAALQSEQNARIRLELFMALAKDAPERLGWAESVYRAKPGKFIGTDESFDEGEQQELAYYFQVLINVVPLQPLALEIVDAALKAEKPEWVLLWTCSRLREYLAEQRKTDVSLDRVPSAVFDGIHDLLRRGTAPESTRIALFWCWAGSFDSFDNFFAELSVPAMRQYLIPLIADYREYVLSSQQHGTWVALEYKDGYPERLIRAVSDCLAGEDVAFKTRLITALCASTLGRLTAQQPVRQIVDAGLAKKDANYPDYLALLGKLSTGPADFDLLRAAANDPRPEVARGAIKGLKDALAGEAADVRLMEILNEGTNDGVKADAFAALIERNPRDKDKLVDEYLDPVKPVTLRVVAVARVPAKDVERLQTLAEDEQLKVRQAAINRLGALKDKKLLSFLKRVSTHDTSPVLRQLAAKYAAELE